MQQAIQTPVFTQSPFNKPDVPISAFSTAQFTNPSTTVFPDSSKIQLRAPSLFQFSSLKSTEKEKVDEVDMDEGDCVEEKQFGLARNEIDFARKEFDLTEDGVDSSRSVLVGYVSLNFDRQTLFSEGKMCLKKTERHDLRPNPKITNMTRY